MQQRVEKLKEEVKTMLANVCGHLGEEMDLVDTIQRLGLAYHFEEEIRQALLRINDTRVDSEDLHVISLRFRLLRQDGYYISPDEFNKFKDVDGDFRRNLGSDVKGLLSLYEAAYLGTQADIILEEAITFCRSKLEPMLDHLQHPISLEVVRALETPLIRRMKRLEARQYISFYEANQRCNDSTLELAKIDFNLLQLLHQEEIRNLSLWWKELGMIRKLNFARDRLVEGYFWIVGVYYEPSLSCARIMMTKVIALLSVLDDIYDSFGTLEELNFFSSIIQRWDISALGELPEYLKIYLITLIDAIKEFEDELTNEQRSFCVEYLKELKYREWMQQIVEKLKEEVKTMLANARGHLEEEMDLVDTIQRLGLTYHFEEEIRQTLVNINDTRVDSEDLHVISLRFRLLRQDGYYISPDEFNKFKDVDGHFRRNLGFDVKGLLSLYEAAYLGTQADIILEEAITFCRSKLEPMLDHLQHPILLEVARALETPLIRRMKRLEARQYISFYEASQRCNDSMLELAKINFNLLQLLHQEEIRNLSMWWNELGMIRKLNFARDRLVEGYFWAVGVYYEPSLSRARIMMTKMIALLTVLDDIYDSFGTLEELNFFTSIIQRWDINALGELPEYMKIYFIALIDTVKEFEDELTNEQRSYRVEYLKELFKELVLAYMEEANWRNKEFMPTLEEHLRISLVSSGYHIVTCASFLGMGAIATKEAFDWVMGFPNIVKASSAVARLMNDITSHEFEQKRQHVASTVECYMKEYDASRKMACQKLYEMIDDAWKVMNHECLKPSTVVPLQLLALPFNLARVIEIYYKHSDAYTHSSGATKDLISLLLVKCI